MKIREIDKTQNDFQARVGLNRYFNRNTFFSLAFRMIQAKKSNVTKKLI